MNTAKLEYTPKAQNSVSEPHVRVWLTVNSASKLFRNNAHLLPEGVLEFGGHVESVRAPP